MKTKLVYVLSSNDADYYTEQTFLSVYSARLHNPDVVIILVTDQGTKDYLDKTYSSTFLNYFDEIKTVHVDQSLYPTTKLKSRLLKTTLPKHVKGDFLYIDVDTIVCEDLSDIDDMKGPVGATMVRHLPKEYRSLYFPNHVVEKLHGDPEMEILFNGGVILARECLETDRFFDAWHDEWEKSQKSGNSQDQPALHRAVKLTGMDIELLDGIWNCQLIGNALPYLHDAKIIHFITSGRYVCPSLLARKDIFKEVRQNGGLTDNIKRMIDNPKAAFHPLNNIISGANSIKLINSDFFSRLSYYHECNSRLYSYIVKVSNLIADIYCSLSRIKQRLRL